MCLSTYKGSISVSTLTLLNWTDVDFLPPWESKALTLINALSLSLTVKKKVLKIIFANSEGLNYKTFYGCNLWIFIISYGVCLLQASPA
jgi:hypothetical protein